MIKDTGPTATNADIRISPIENCRFAYTINNMQPVLCSWISDQPLFFNDCEIEEEEDILDDPIFKALEKDIASLRHKTDAYEKISKEFIEPLEIKSLRFLADAEFISAPYAKEAQNSCEELIKNSRFASMLYSFAQIHGVSFQETAQVADVFYDREASCILVRPDLDNAAKTLLIARELRRVWQHRNGAGMHPLMLHPDHAVVVNRAQLADLTISMIRTAWELQLAGEKEAWTRIENSTMADLGRAFAREACSDFRSLNSGKASIACFESWFLSERCRKADRGLIQQMLADYQGYVSADNAEASRSITFDLLSALGKVPFGDNYLAKCANQILADTVFTEVRDRSNANFLWFIKFERSFRDGEAEIAQEQKKTTGHSHVQKTKLSQREETRPSATVISLPVRTEAAAQVKQANGRAADIVLFIPPVE
ncbi:MAG: hypothetical protein DI586_04900 [Micavibrio aeruginosavorus]|uniref:DUF6782 domain-containing protein n=1 Tax=Micavibrio aeruginosavorus TaxID=349221 RepID=A0A2W5FM30_9BACT|nr:MAG: hypothetical protein DI586_04900 [Micavibrio aeruginosavorus]